MRKYGIARGEVTVDTQPWEVAMTKTGATTAILILIALLAACTRVGHIQRTEPVRP
jgi:hypothetical protein